jgi:hypothetical protein
MLQDLAALAPSLIVGGAFLVGVVALVRRELAPRRRDRAPALDTDQTAPQRGEGHQN